MIGSGKRRWPLVLIGLGIVGVLSAECAVRISPAFCPELGLAGIAFPFSWFCLAVGVVGGLICRRWRIFRWGLLVLVLSAPHASQTWGWSFLPNDLGTESPIWSYSPGASSRFVSSSSEAPIEFNLLSWNVRQFDRFGWLNNPSAREEILTHLGAVGSDIICMQEFFLEASDTPWMTKERLESATGLTHWAVEYGLGREQEKTLGLAVLSKFPILSVRVIPFSNDDSNSAMQVDLLVEKDTIRVFNVHLSSIHFGPEDYEAIRHVPDESQRIRLLDRLKVAWVKRALQAELVAEEVARSPYPVLLAGDFNDGPVSYARQQFQPYLNDAYTGCGPFLGATYVGDIPGMRIDFILHSPAFDCIDFTTDEVVLSDHRSIHSTLQLQL